MKGSSPRVWGQAPILTNNSNKFRIIPTRVGTSSVNFPIVHLSFHHPHACGDKFIRFPFPFRWRGSSPRVWGQVCPSVSFRNDFRIIPTRVGTSRQKYNAEVEEKDHPHACGDKCRCSIAAVVKGGSSPRVWGQVVCLLCRQTRSRIIPTRVGTSLKVPNNRIPSRDHPHACGDKLHG